MSFPKSAGEPPSGVPPKSASLAFILRSAILPDRPTRLLQGLCESRQAGMPFRIVRGERRDDADTPRPCGLLRARRERPSRSCAASIDRIAFGPLPGPDCRLPNWQFSVSGCQGVCTTCQLLAKAVSSPQPLREEYGSRRVCSISAGATNSPQDRGPVNSVVENGLRQPAGLRSCGLNPLIQQWPLARGLPRARKACQRCLAASFRSCS
jgi:hypothetical protein